MPFIKWPSIEQFSHVYKTAHRFEITQMMFRPKIKLHGTNAAIRIENGEVKGQKRSSDVSLENDNAGFAAWLNDVEVLNLPENDHVLVFFGEWAGPGVQKSDAVAGIERRQFFVFSVIEYDPQGEELIRIFEPRAIQGKVNEFFGEHPDIHVIPWYDVESHLDFTDQDALQEFVTGYMNRIDNEISRCDPYILEVFGVEGPGEGLVFYPVGVHEDYWRAYMFKMKSEKHSVNQSKKRDHVAPEKPEGVDEFIDMFFTEARFEQMLNDELGGVADRRKTGDFLKAVMTDVHKECQDELELADFEWKDVNRYALDRTKKWFFQRCDQF